MSSKSELKRMAVVNPLGMADKVAQLEAQLAEYQAREQVEPVVWMASTHLDGFVHQACGTDSMFARCSYRQLHTDYKPLYAQPPLSPDVAALQESLKQAEAREGELCEAIKQYSIREGELVRKLAEEKQMRDNADMVMTKAQEKVGIFGGCDSPYEFADEIIALRQKLAKLQAALTKLRDCDWVISLPDRMDAVREIARNALDGGSEELTRLLSEARNSVPDNVVYVQCHKHAGHGWSRMLTALPPPRYVCPNCEDESAAPNKDEEC